MTTLQKTETEIRRLVPRLMELSFGCKFYYRKEWREDILTFVCAYLDTGNTTSVCHLWEKTSESTINDFDINECEIIGHPITLEDVLEALMTFQNDEEVNVSRISDFYGLILRRDWQFGKPYSEQPQEVHEFVANVLFNE